MTNLERKGRTRRHGIAQDRNKSFAVAMELEQVQVLQLDAGGTKYEGAVVVGRGPGLW